MFRFADIGRMWVPVDLPAGEGEGEDTTRIWLLQTLYTREELRARDKALTARASEGLEAAGGQVRNVEDVTRMVDRVNGIEDDDLAEVLARTHDWRDVVDDGNRKLEFSTDRFQALLQYQWFSRAARAALFNASREGVRKNSSPGPGGSPGRPQG